MGWQRNQSVYPTYAWFPDALSRATHSSEFLAMQLINFCASKPAPSEEEKGNFIDAAVFRGGLGVHDATHREAQEVKEAADRGDSSSLKKLLGFMLSSRANLGWTTHGHTGVDVMLYAYFGKDIEQSLKGNMENTDIGIFLAELLNTGLEFPFIT